MKNEQIMATANNIQSGTPDGILLFQLAPLYSNETRKGCGLLGKEIDANFQYLNGNDVVDFKVETLPRESGMTYSHIIITLRNGYEYSINVEDSFRPDSYDFDPVHGIFTVTRYNGEQVKLYGFLTEGTDVKVVTDGTIDGNGTWAKPLTLNPTLKTGVYSPVEEYVDLTIGSGITTLEDYIEEHRDKYKKLNGLRFLTKEMTNSFGYLYSLKGAKEVEEIVGGGWRIPTLQEWDGMLNYIENMNGCTCSNMHEGYDIAELGCRAGKVLKSTDLWIEDPENFGTDELGFCVLPVGSMLCNQDIDEEIVDFRRNAYFWTGTDYAGNGAWIKSFSFTNSTVRQEPDAGIRMYSLRLVKDADWDGIENVTLGGEIVPCACFKYVDDEGMVRSLAWTLINVAIPVSDGKEYRYPTKWEEYSATTGYKNVQPGYYICEYTNDGWKKRQMMDGEQVIILDCDSLDGTDDEGKEYCQYRVQWDEELEEYVLVDILAEFRNEVEEMIADIRDILDNLLAQAHTHDNKELLDEITEERVYMWDNAERRANEYTDRQISSLSGAVVNYIDDVKEELQSEINELSGAVSDYMAETDEKIDTLSADVRTIGDSVGLDEEYLPDFKVYEYVEIPLSEVPESGMTEFEFVPENPTDDDVKYPEYIYVPDIYISDIKYYRKEEATKYISDAENVIDALKKLDKGIVNAIESAHTFAEEALEEAKEYADNIAGDLQNQIDLEREERHTEDRKLYVKPLNRTIETIHSTDGTSISVNLPEINTADTTPNHLWYDNKGLYFDGFFGILPEEITTGGIHTTIVYMGLTKENTTNKNTYDDDSVVYCAVTWTANWFVYDGAPVGTDTELHIRVSENVEDYNGDFNILTFESGITASKPYASDAHQIIDEFDGSRTPKALNELTNEFMFNSLKFVANNSTTIMFNENGVNHTYELKTLDEVEHSNRVLYGIKLHKDVENSGITINDYNNATTIFIDENNSIRPRFFIPPVGVRNYETMSSEERAQADIDYSYDIFIITNREIEYIINDDQIREEDDWCKKCSIVNGIYVSKLSNGSYTNIYDSLNAAPGESNEFDYLITFFNN